LTQQERALVACATVVEICCLNQALLSITAADNLRKDFSYRRILTCRDLEKINDNIVAKGNSEYQTFLFFLLFEEKKD